MISLHVSPKTRREYRSLVGLFAATVVLFLVACSNEYNPFADASNAGVVIASSETGIHHGDTLEIFSTSYLTVVVKVRELCDSLAVSAPGNRLWPHSDSTNSKDALDSTSEFSFAISYRDTGYQQIAVTLFRNDGIMVTETLGVHTQTPLNQPDVNSITGDTVTLKTPPVGDNDVNYFWSFGSGSIYSSQRCSLRVAPQTPFLKGTGRLWVSDGFAVSPESPFLFSFSDTVRPVITCVNEGFIGEDTIFTSDSLFAFKVRVTDHQDRWVDSTSIDGGPFDSKSNRIYTKWFDRMYEHGPSNPKTVNVYALDHYENGNETTGTFHIVYSDTAPRSVPAEIVLVLPSVDSTVLGNDSVKILGFVRNHSLDTFNLSLALVHNATAHQDTASISVTDSTFEWNLGLADGSNAILLRLFQPSSSTLIDIVERTVVYVPETPDTLSPRILSIRLNGTEATNLYTSKSTVAIAVEAADEGGTLDSLIINGSLIVPSTGSRWFHDTIALEHIASGNEIFVRAVDKAGNDSSRTVIVYRNRPALVQRAPASSQIPTDSLYSDTLIAFDPDGDTLAYEIIDGPDQMSVTNEGIVSWTPDTADTGTNRIIVRVWDGYQPVTVAFSLVVYIQGTLPPPPVRFGTAESDFPPFLEVGRDTLRIPLRVAPGTGVAPFAFDAYVRNADIPILTSGGDSVVWAPTIDDTGTAHLVVTVHDALPERDTLFPHILIVPPNRPCTIGSKFSSDTLSGGVIDLNGKQDADTLIFKISDPDNPVAERYDITISQWRTQLVHRIDSARVDSFRLVVDPEAFDGYDTITVVVTDRGGNTDTLKKTLYYGMPPYSPQLIAPIAYGTISGTSVTLSWQTGDPDSDALRYEVYLGTNPQDLPLVATTTEPTHSIQGLSSSTSYYWRIVAHDWKSRTQGSVWEFSTP